MYNFTNLAKNNPTRLAVVAQQILFTLQLGGVINLQEDLLLAIVGVVSTLLGVFWIADVTTQAEDNSIDDENSDNSIDPLDN